jgi:hypothetical protein
MRIIFIIYLLALFVLLCGKSFGAESSCHLAVNADDNGFYGKEGEPPGAAKIFGAQVVVPSFQVKFVEEETGRDIIPEKVAVSYSWRWLEYPYPEHPWGVWSSASDGFDCVASESGVHVVEFKVRPRGWYDGKYTRFPWSKRPSFTGISIGFKIAGNGFSPYAEITPKEVEKISGKTVVIKVKPYGKCDIVIQ